MTDKQVNRHDRRRERTRKLIQNAMLELVLEKGFESIVIQEITDRADLGRATFYFHFGCKEDVLWSIIEDCIHVTESELAKMFGEELPAQPEYYGYLNMFRHVKQNEKIYRLIGSKGTQEVANRVKEYMVKETLRDIENFGVYGDINQSPEITAQIVVGLFFSLTFWWIETPNEYTLEDMAEIMYRTLHRKDPPSIPQGQ